MQGPNNAACWWNGLGYVGYRHEGGDTLFYFSGTECELPWIVEKMRHHQWRPLEIMFFAYNRHHAHLVLADMLREALRVNVSAYVHYALRGDRYDDHNMKDKAVWIDRCLQTLNCQDQWQFHEVDKGIILKAHFAHNDNILS